MRRMGHIQGGAATVVAAIRDVIGSDGTMVVPTETANNSDGSRDHLAGISGMSADQIRQYRAVMPPFDPIFTPSFGMGRVAEQVRTMPGAVRSTHPQSSFAAQGPLARRLMAGHKLDCHLGES